MKLSPWRCALTLLTIVIPADAGIQFQTQAWIPAFAGMTGGVYGSASRKRYGIIVIPANARIQVLVWEPNATAEFPAHAAEGAPMPVIA